MSRVVCSKTQAVLFDFNHTSSNDIPRRMSHISPYFTTHSMKISCVNLHTHIRPHFPTHGPVKHRPCLCDGSGRNLQKPEYRVSYNRFNGSKITCLNDIVDRTYTIHSECGRLLCFARRPERLFNKTAALYLIFIPTLTVIRRITTLCSSVLAFLTESVLFR